MKLLNKISAVLLMTMLAMGSAYAYQPTNTNSAKSLSNEASVVIAGKIVRHLGGKRYELQDSSGKIRVEIDDYSPNQVVGRNVTIRGTVDRGGRSAEIDANSVTVY